MPRLENGEIHPDQDVLIFSPTGPTTSHPWKPRRAPFATLLRPRKPFASMPARGAGHILELRARAPSRGKNPKAVARGRQPHQKRSGSASAPGLRSAVQWHASTTRSRNPIIAPACFEAFSVAALKLHQRATLSGRHNPVAVQKGGQCWTAHGRNAIPACGGSCVAARP